MFVSVYKDLQNKFLNYVKELQNNPRTLHREIRMFGINSNTNLYQVRIVKYVPNNGTRFYITRSKCYFERLYFDF